MADFFLKTYKERIMIIGNYPGKSKKWAHRRSKKYIKRGDYKTTHIMVEAN